MTSRLYAYFLSSWKNYTIDETGIQNAVTKGYLTQEEADTIIATPR
jgi:hypothetical protein